MRLKLWSRLLVVLASVWLIIATVFTWFLRPVVTDVGIAISPSPNPLWHLGSAPSFVITPNISALLSLYLAPIGVLLLLFWLVKWLARGGRNGNA